jgi:polyhydroxybutyrate depolymerase
MANRSKTPRFVSVVVKLLAGLAALVVVTIAVLTVVFLIVDTRSGTIISSGEKRAYLLHVPESYNEATPVALVIAIHGFAEWPAHEALISHWNDVADEEGFIVVYPSGTRFPKRWRASGTATNGDDPLIDVHFITDLIDHLQAQYNIDPARIYANGLSNGGGMSYLLACSLSERIAAVGSIAGAYLYPLGDCSPTRPVPMMVFHGTADPVVPYRGGPSRSFEVPFPFIPAWVKGYATSVNHCSPAPELFPSSGNDISGMRYMGCDQDAEVVFYSIAGGGNSWPGGDPIPYWIVGKTSQSIDATRVMWEFFQAHPLE